MLKDFDCEFAPIVLQTMRRRENSKVKNLMVIVHSALGNIVLVPHLKELTEALTCINGTVDICNTVKD